MRIILANRTYEGQPIDIVQQMRKRHFHPGANAANWIKSAVSDLKEIFGVIITLPPRGDSAAYAGAYIDGLIAHGLAKPVPADDRQDGPIVWALVDPAHGKPTH